MLTCFNVSKADLLSAINCPIPPAHCMLGLLACNEAYEFGQLGTGLSWFMKYAVLNADEFF